ncbi:MAG: PilZ domain-containing protein [Proteobacteria bacterium]|nr:PilZ domain-containing protein [Pseudomonadota bacterium]
MTLVDPSTRDSEHPRVTLKITFKSETLEQFIERYAMDVSQKGIFIRRKEPLAVGTRLRFEFKLRNESLIRGEGTVVWAYENDPGRPTIAPGMGIRFDRLDDGSQIVLEKILAGKTQRGSTQGSVFADAPTRMTPPSLQDALLRTDRDSSFEQPKPMPVRSDADDFDSETFDDATEIDSVYDLAASSPEGDPKAATFVMPAELARRSHLETNSPRADSADPTNPSARGFKLEAKTRLGVEPAKVPTLQRLGERISTIIGQPRGNQASGVLAKSSLPSAPKPGRRAPRLFGIAIGIGIGIGVGYFALKANDRPPTGNTVVTNGSSSLITASATATHTATKGPIVDTVIESNIPTSTILVIDTDQTGLTPLTAKLEKDKEYKVRVEAAGYAKLQLDVVGGQGKVIAWIIPKPRFLSVTSEPPASAIFIDDISTGRLTPFDVELTEAQVAKPNLRIALRKAGFHPVDQLVDATTFIEEDPRMVLKVKATLVPEPLPLGATASATEGSGSAK